MSESQDRSCVFCRNNFQPKEGWHTYARGDRSSLYKCGNSPTWLVDWTDIESQMKAWFERTLEDRKKRWYEAGKPPIMDLRERDLEKEAYEEWLDKGTYKASQAIKVMRGFDS